jgi:photosystem II stability/assembly factor-like uncharacterized protein
MKAHIFLLIVLTTISCKKISTERIQTFSKVKIEILKQDTLLSVRALDYNEDFLFYGSSGHFGKIDVNRQSEEFIDESALPHASNQKLYIKKNKDGNALNFRAIELVNDDLFAISIESPAKLYKLDSKTNKAKLVYEETHPIVFYDALEFWNDKEGIAIGDPTENCMSIIITRDGGNTWNKISCEALPEIINGEAAFAASDTNIAIVGNKTWVATGGVASRILFSPDKGKTWQVFDTPIIQGMPTIGMYSIDFYDENNGFAIGGDYTKPDNTIDNKIKTTDGGKTWKVVANGKSPGYRSCVQFVPNSNAKELVAVGFKGIDYSTDAGVTWTQLSDDSFYTIRFVNDTVAYAGGKGRIAKLVFK